MTEDSKNVMLSTEEVASYFGVTEDTVRRWLRQGIINGKYKKGRWQVTLAEVEKAVRKRYGISE